MTAKTQTKSYQKIEPLKQTYQADCRKIAAIDPNKLDWDTKNREY